MKKGGGIAFFIVFSELLFCFITVLFFYLQNFWISRGWNEFQIGTVFAIHAFIAGLTALKAEEIERKIGERGVLSLVPLVWLACL